MSRHAYELSLPAFRPSVYSTGLQQTQPYTRTWPEGTEYGDWTAYLPWNYIPAKVSEATTSARDTVASAGSAYLSTVQSVAQSMSSAYQAKLAADEAERIRKEEEAAAAQRTSLLKAGGALLLGVGGFVLVQRYRKTGKIL